MNQAHFIQQSARVEVNRQTVDYTEHLEMIEVLGTRTKLRVHISNNSYDFQSWATIERWDGATWREVASVKGKSMKMKHGICYRVPVTEKERVLLFKCDRDVLVELAKEVLL